MSLSEPQSRQVGALLGYALLEIRTRIAQQDHVAASDLAYACHNLPSFMLGSGHFDRPYFRRWFIRFHELHGKSLFNYLAMLDSAKMGEKISAELAMAPLGEITPIAHEFITLGHAPPKV